MKTPSITLILSALFLASVPAKASVTINFDIGEITSGGSLVNSGTFLFVSHGTNNVLDSSSWATGTSFIKGDDYFMGAFSISNGAATSAIAGWVSPTGYGSTEFTGIFVAGLTSTDIDYSNGSLLGGKTFTASGGGGVGYQFGSYRTNLIEGFGAGPSGNMAWVIPNMGSALSLWAYSNTDLRGDGLYTAADISANLATTSALYVVPEPSTVSLMMLGAAGLVALRRLRKV